ncbi:MAG: AAA family ATPase [Spirochaetia bacterium]
MNQKADLPYIVEKTNELQTAITSIFVGKPYHLRILLIGFFSGLHVLIEDIPGVGKTTLARSLASASGLDMGRIQFTPDLLPGDITGMTVWNQEKREFQFKPGGVMHQFILADEINRASARTQSALLEAMQEHSVTVDGVSYPLPSPFFVIATQNPISFAGTFVLPEGQMDRFGISFSIGYPDSSDEVTILDRFQEQDSSEGTAVLPPSVMTAQDILKIRETVKKIRVDKKIKKYLTELATATRKSSAVRLGMSPRATLHLMSAAQANAVLEERDFVIPEDVANVAHSVLRHRILLTAGARMESKTTDDVISDILSRVPKPTGL